MRRCTVLENVYATHNFFNAHTSVQSSFGILELGQLPLTHHCNGPCVLQLPVASAFDGQREEAGGS